ncbi:MAG: adenosine-specific kinase, partial [bacterium]
ILGVIDGHTPVGIENKEDITWRKDFLRNIGYKLFPLLLHVTAVGLADFGNYVTATDIDNGKIDILKSGKSPIYEPGIEEYLNRNMKSGRLAFSTDIESSVKDADVVFIGVGTPASENGEADLSQLISATETIGRAIEHYTVIVIKSTVPVGTNQKITELISKQTDKKLFDIVSNPEFLREGKAVYDFFHPDRVVIGFNNNRAKAVLEDVYRTLYLNQTPFVWCNAQTAELIKYASNAYLATKIGFINQIANLSENVGAEIKTIAKALGMDGRISPKFLHPGPGYGGSCFPKDTKALVHIGSAADTDMSIVNEVIKSNEYQKRRVVRKLEKYFAELEGLTIAMLGLAFKSETDDVRESPSITVAEELLARKVRLRVNDPKAMDNFGSIFKDRIEYFEDEFDAVRDADAVLIMTEWNEYRNIDLERVKALMKGKLIYDTRNIIDSENALELGFDYMGTGRSSELYEDN